MGHSFEELWAFKSKLPEGRTKKTHHTYQEPGKNRAGQTTASGLCTPGEHLQPRARRRHARESWSIPHLHHVSVVDPGIPRRHLDVVVGGHGGQLHHSVAGRLEAAVLKPHLSPGVFRGSGGGGGVGPLASHQLAALIVLATLQVQPHETCYSGLVTPMMKYEYYVTFPRAADNTVGAKGPKTGGGAAEKGKTSNPNL